MWFVPILADLFYSSSLIFFGTSETLSPNSFIGGHSRIGKICFLGANSSIMPKVSLNDSSRLSASSVLYRNTEKFTLSHGNPAKTKKLYK